MNKNTDDIFVIKEPLQFYDKPEDAPEGEEVLFLNPGKEQEAIIEVMTLLAKKNKSKEEETRLFILSVFAFGMTPDQLTDVCNWVGSKMPKGTNLNDKAQVDYEIDRILRGLVRVSKKKAL